MNLVNNITESLKKSVAQAAVAAKEAGKINFEELPQFVLEVPKGTDIRKLKAQVGVGTLTVNDLQVEELDGECGVGEFDFSGEIKKFGNLKCGIGSMYLNLVGSEKDYDYSLECGMGNISLGDRDFSGLGSGQEISNGSDKKFTLECGMGEIEVDFEKEA